MTKLKTENSVFFSNYKSCPSPAGGGRRG